MLTEDGHFLSALQIASREQLESFFKTSELFTSVARGENTTSLLEGAVVANLFFEPSTRTRLSFESATARLGAKSITVTGTELISVAKGESYSDTARVVSGYCDLIVLRTASPAITEEFVTGAIKPVINGGSGSDEHPTQSLLDIYTAERELASRGKTIDGSHIAFIGDLKHGRTVHSLLKILRLYKNLAIYLIAPDGLELPTSLVDTISRSGASVQTCSITQIPDVLHKADIVYATRLQKERLEPNTLLRNYPDSMCINEEIVNDNARKDVIIMHPLPRDSRQGSNDLPFRCSDPRLVIFNQTDNGVLVRMALISRSFGISDEQIRNSLRPAPWHRS